MKTRISVKIDYELYEKYREYAPDGHKSKILESLIIQYLKDNKVRIWDEWADENGNLGPVYGYQSGKRGGRYQFSSPA